MKRSAAPLALLAALSVLACGPGPVPVPLYTDLTLYWQFQDGDGNVYGDFTAANPGCGVRTGPYPGGITNVDTIRVVMTGPFPTWELSVPCTAVNGMPGATFTGVPTGAYGWLVQGIRLGLPVFEVTGGGDVFDFPFFDLRLQAVYPNMDLYYDLPPGVNCTGIAEIAFNLYNLVGQVTEYSSDNAYVACGPARGFTMPSIPQGQYGVRWMEALPAMGPPLYKACRVGFPPQSPLQQTLPLGNAYTIALFPGDGTWCPD